MVNSLMAAKNIFIKTNLKKNYEWQISTDNQTWTTVDEGEFANIKSNPVEQNITLRTATKARYIKFIGKSSIEGNYVSVAELGVKTVK